jgi:serine/threonine-protein kinase
MSSAIPPGQLVLPGPHALAGNVIADRYHVQNLSKRGTVASVYAGQDLRERRPVALKVIGLDSLMRRSGQHSSDLVEQFDAAISHCRRLSSPYTLPLLDHGRTASFLYVVSESAEGENLQRMLNREVRIDPLRALRFATHIAASLEESHNYGWWHGDIRPATLFIARDPQGRQTARVLDHGISRLLAAPMAVQLSATGRAAGVPDYMSPEQCQGGLFDRRSDLYSLGIVLFQMLTGTVPFRGRSPLWVMQQHVGTAAPRVSEVNPRLGRMPRIDAVVEGCLTKNPEGRFASARRLMQALDVAIEEYLAAH